MIFDHEWTDKQIDKASCLVAIAAENTSITFVGFVLIYV